jgi:hypothetical protein
MFLKSLRFLSIYLTALTMSLTFCHLLELRPKMRYEEGMYLAVQHSLYRYFAPVGAFAEVGAVLCLIVLSFVVLKRKRTFFLTFIATLCIAAGLGVWVIAVSPANVVMAEWSNVPLPANWIEVRKHWEYGHAVSAILDLVGFSALLGSVIFESTRPTQPIDV